MAATALESKQYIPRRVVLYVPGSDERKLRKIPTIGADCVVMDCEDGVALSKKEAARSMIHTILQSQEIDFTGKDCSVRFNSVQSGLCEADMQEILSAKFLPSTVHLPKVDSVEHLEWFADKLKLALKDHKDAAKLRLIIFTESAESLLSLPEICRRGVELSRDAPFELDGIVFGSDDYCADIDLGGLKIQSEEGAGMGFTGKQVIHPSQVPVVYAAFSPHPDKVEWAAALVQAFQQYQTEGKGAFTFRGQMIDMPLLLQARNILQIVSHTIR
ncbi:Citramalyl-CoA lyase-like [Homarus americanus]|uniref:Citramalyl-CoA lyase-like n=1 Tax=Homarus americanus TaxID=6706 RepID=A0A8J5NAD7_HOMAM|nr:Citramalyl-CoA lyase-like [Homarus americanus]